MAPPLVAPKASEAGSPLEGADGNTGGVDCKGRDPKGDPGTVGRAILPQGHDRAERSEAYITGRGRDGCPPLGIPLIGGGASEGGIQGGKPRRGRRGTPFAHPALKGGRG